jgi:hypothetical protein
VISVDINCLKWSNESKIDTETRKYTYPNLNTETRKYIYPNLNTETRKYTYPNLNTETRKYTYPNVTSVDTTFLSPIKITWLDINGAQEQSAEENTTPKRKLTWKLRKLRNGELLQLALFTKHGHNYGPEIRQ